MVFKRYSGEAGHPEWGPDVRCLRVPERAGRRDLLQVRGRPHHPAAGGRVREGLVVGPATRPPPGGEEGGPAQSGVSA